MIDFSRNHFALFDLPQRFQIDHAKLEEIYRRLQSAVHPDKFVQASESDKRLALQASARVNEAYEVLSDSLTRAHYLLTLRGIESLSETDTAMPVEFLQQQLQWQEKLEEADLGELHVLLAEITDYRKKLKDELVFLLDSEQDAENWNRAKTTVRKLKFTEKIVMQIDERMLEAEF